MRAAAKEACPASGRNIMAVRFELPEDIEHHLEKQCSNPIGSTKRIGCLVSPASFLRWQRDTINSFCHVRLAAFLRGDPCGDPGFQRVEGKRAPVQNLIMERPDIILIPELRLRTLAQLDDFQLP